MAQYDFTRTLAANEEIILNCAASNRFQVMAADDVFYLKPGGQGRIKVELGVGQKTKQTFDSLWLQNGPTPQTIELKVSDSDVIDNRMVGSVDISGGIRLAASPAGGYGNVTVGVSAVLIAAASANRSSILIQNLGSASIFIGTDNSVTTANGIEVAAGRSASFTLGTDIYGISDADRDVRYLNEDLA